MSNFEGEIFNWPKDFQTLLAKYTDFNESTKSYHANDNDPGFDLLEFEYLRLHNKYVQQYEVGGVALEKAAEQFVNCHIAMSLKKLVEQGGGAYPVP